MITIRNKQRFEDIGEQGAAGFYDYVYRGFNYEIATGEREFYVRTYDDEPGIATVVKPTNALTSSDARQLVDFSSPFWDARESNSMLRMAGTDS